MITLQIEVCYIQEEDRYRSVITMLYNTKEEKCAMYRKLRFVVGGGGCLVRLLERKQKRSAKDDIWSEVFVEARRNSDDLAL